MLTFSRVVAGSFNLDPHGGVAIALGHFGNGSELVVFDGDGSVQCIFDVGSTILKTTISPDDRWVAVGRYISTNIQVYSVEARALAFELSNDMQPLSLEISPDGRLLAASTEGKKVRCFLRLPQTSLLTDCAASRLWCGS